MANFFKRWSELKTAQSQTIESPPKPEEKHFIDESPKTASDIIEQKEDLKGPSLADVAKLNKDSDFSLFVQNEVSDDVHHAAMKKLFSDPHYNVMDGLDIYIDDYSKEDPLPSGMLEKMVQSSMLGLFKKAPESEEQVIPKEIESSEEKINSDMEKGPSEEIIAFDSSQKVEETPTHLKDSTDD